MLSSLAQGRDLTVLRGKASVPEGATTLGLVLTRPARGRRARPRGPELGLKNIERSRYKVEETLQLGTLLGYHSRVKKGRGLH